MLAALFLSCSPRQESTRAHRWGPVVDRTLIRRGLAGRELRQGLPEAVVLAAETVELGSEAVLLPEPKAFECESKTNSDYPF